MRERKIDSPAPAPWRVPVAVEDIDEGGRHFALAAADETRADVARIAGLRDLPRLEADFEVTRQGEGLHVVGRVSASVGQNCVITLEPLSKGIDEAVDLVFMPRPATEQAAGEVETVERREAKLDDPEPLIGGMIDLGAIATEFLILGLDPYPRQPSAVFEPAREQRPDGGPFAALADRMKGRSDS